MGDRGEDKTTAGIEPPVAAVKTGHQWYILYPVIHRCCPEILLKKNTELYFHILSYYKSDITNRLLIHHPGVSVNKPKAHGRGQVPLLEDLRVGLDQVVRDVVAGQVLQDVPCEPLHLKGGGKSLLFNSDTADTHF